MCVYHDYHSYYLVYGQTEGARKSDAARRVSAAAYAGICICVYIYIERERDR